MTQAPNQGRILCNSKFDSKYKNNDVRNCEKNCVSWPYLLKASLFQFKQVNKTVLSKSYGSSNLACAILYEGCKSEKKAD